MKKESKRDLIVIGVAIVFLFLVMIFVFNQDTEELPESEQPQYDCTWTGKQLQCTEKL